MDAADPQIEFDRLLRPHLDRMYRFAHRLTGSTYDADDLFQDVLAKVYCRRDELAGVRDLAAWVCRVMYNQFVDDRRRFDRRRLVSVDEQQLPGQGIEDQPGGLDTQAEVETADDIMRLDRAMSVLSDQHRLVLVLHDGEGYKLSEIQTLTGEPLGTLKSRLHRARARLREIINVDATFSGRMSCKEL